MSTKTIADWQTLTDRIEAAGGVPAVRHYCGDVVGWLARRSTGDERQFRLALADIIHGRADGLVDDELARASWDAAWEGHDAVSASDAAYASCDAAYASYDAASASYHAAYASYYAASARGSDSDRASARHELTRLAEAYLEEGDDDAN